MKNHLVVKILLMQSIDLFPFILALIKKLEVGKVIPNFTTREEGFYDD